MPAGLLKQADGRETVPIGRRTLSDAVGGRLYAQARPGTRPAQTKQTAYTPAILQN